jgi:hypothetical protein
MASLFGDCLIVRLQVDKKLKKVSKNLLTEQKISDIISLVADKK